MLALERERLTTRMLTADACESWPPTRATAARTVKATLMSTAAAMPAVSSALAAAPAN
jgi:hypothetical protein